MLIFPIFIPHEGCPQTCIYCDQYQITHVVKPNWDILKDQIAQFCRKHQSEYKEIAFYGGSFTCLQEEYQHYLIQQVTHFIDDRTFLRYSTRPDGIDHSILTDSYSKGVRTVELGIQDFNEQVLAASERGYTRQEAIDACLLVKESGMKLSVQLMPGLPGYSKETLTQTIADTLTVRPEFIRIYPTIVIQGTPLERMYRSDQYQPLSLDDAIQDAALMAETFEKGGITVIKIGLTGIDDSHVVAGPFHQAFGELVRAELYMKRIIQTYEPGKVLEISKKDVSLLLGNKKEYLTRMKKIIKQNNLMVIISDILEKGEFRYVSDTNCELW
ncbi:MAG TPA: radical SAM protein [Candidatus Cloacimonadota bacterium]|nr:radical SAM protein [Candidatus Cloacimonadota bacterium]